MSHRAFTLIELLVVIAIIGTLSSIVVSSLNSARNKSVDASIRESLQQARNQAELFYASNNNEYFVLTNPARQLCSASATGSATNGVSGVYRILKDAAEKYAPGTPITNGGRDTEFACNDNFSNSTQYKGWALQAVLKSGETLCVDYKGNATSSMDGNILRGVDDISCNHPGNF